jgi:hypothetical protein
VVELDNLDLLFIVTAFLFQLLLIGHFALRRWRFGLALRYGPVVYALSIPAAFCSSLLLVGGKPWWLWLSGILYLIWGVFGYTVEYRMGLQWRDPIRWSVFGPYVSLYLATMMFYWWPLARLSQPLWCIYAFLFVVSTALNVASHGRPESRA